MTSLRTTFTLLLALAGSVMAYAGDKESPVSFRTIDVPFADASGTVITGILGQTIVGVYQDAANSTQGFVQTRHGQFQPLLRVIPQDISEAGVTGFLDIPNLDNSPGGNATVSAGFVYDDGTVRLIRVPTDPEGGRLFTEAIAINFQGQVVGDFRGDDGVFRGFLFDPATQEYTTIEVAGAQSTALTGITDAGVIVGNAFSATNERLVFRWENGTFTFLTIPSLTDVDLVGVRSTGSGIEVAGNAGLVGFTYDGTDAQLIEVPGAELTELFGMQPDGTVYGRYIDGAGVNHGFVAAPPRRGQGWSTGLSGHSLERTQAHLAQAGDCVAGSKRRVCRGR
jgi:hypothetical protein